MNNNVFPYSDVPTQFVVSYELLALFAWIVEHDVERLKKLIARYLKDGLKRELENVDTALQQARSTQEEQKNIVDFFNLLEVLMQEAMHEHTVDRALTKNIMPVVDHIDATLCDNEIIALSAEKTSEKLMTDPQIDVRDTLFKELLKRWKPVKDGYLN